MTRKELLLKAFEHNYHRKLLWFYSMFTIRRSGYSDRFIEVTDNSFIIKFGDESYVLDTKRIPGKESAINHYEQLYIGPDDIENSNKRIKTSVGLLLANKIKLSDPMGDLIPYKNKMFTDKDIEKVIPELLRSEELSIRNYLKYTLTTSFLVSTAKIFTVSATEKTLTPPPNMAKIKSDLIKEFNTKYGNDWQSDPVKGIEFKDALGKIDDEYLKSDPAYGKMLSGKIVNNSRPRLFSVFGVEYGFDKTGQSGKFLINSLAEGYQKDNSSLAALFNSGRVGAYDRGSETQDAGSLTKDMIRPTGSLEIREGDCGTTEGRIVTIKKTTAHRYKGSYFIINGKTVLINDPEKYIGKKVEVRSPMHCIKENEQYCSRCMTENLAKLVNGIVLLMIEGGGVILNAKMKSMHKATKNTMVFNIFDVLK